MLHDVVLSGHGFRLEPLALEHAETLAGLVDEAMWSGMSIPMPFGVAGMAELVAATRAAPDLTGFVVRTVQADGTPGDVLGSTAFRDLSLVDRRVEVGRTFYARSTWGSLVNPVTKWLLLRHAFETWDVHRVGFRVDTRNTRSLGAMRRLGAYEEGVMRGHRTAPDGTRADSVMFSILAPEWPTVEVGLLERINAPRVVPVLAPPLAPVVLPLAAS
ncbi:GNAT family N-acetyltransferase [Cellulosimicrobium cellulans]|uniref:GNAT family N-acetyltransferase n=1 Tax=Cellulosimicrobium cellulans TaxID=1710 RepID=UPI001EDBA89B|nr:GNAT family protein [Cellulosimicrobium cellulans]UKJ63592.1 GNAT family N-acetyltransferase [Cellulosimicrobium cellulans]